MSWPARKAVITESTMVAGEDGSFPRISGTFPDTKTTLTVRRFAYGEVSTASSSSRYLALYPVGRVTDVYCDPHDPSFVILYGVIAYYKLHQEPQRTSRDRVIPS
ncbi:MAG: hypothetical protein K9N51_13930 [Candidatus Pacebacteria bacterium]|nr:hypothetical protein [Candidatus Paceibacterota bacterium]